MLTVLYQNVSFILLNVYHTESTQSGKDVLCHLFPLWDWVLVKIHISLYASKHNWLIVKILIAT